MQYKFFNIPAISGDGVSAEEEMNAFLRGHRVLNVQRELVHDGRDSFWSCCVEYLDGAMLESELTTSRICDGILLTKQQNKKPVFLFPLPLSHQLANVDRF